MLRYNRSSLHCSWIGLLWVKNWSSSDGGRDDTRENEEPGWLIFNFFLFWRQLSFALTQLNLDLVMWPRILFWSSEKNALWAPGDSNQAKEGARTWRGSNYPPFRTAAEPTTRRAALLNTHSASEVHALAHRHINLSEYWHERQNWLYGIIKHSLSLWWRKRQCMVMSGRHVDCSRLIIHSISPWSLLQKQVTDTVNTHLRRIYDSDLSLGGLSTCFMTAVIRGDISFFMCDTYKQWKYIFSSGDDVSLCRTPRGVKSLQNLKWDALQDWMDAQIWKINVF